jgi:hypothetical protein
MADQSIQVISDLVERTRLGDQVATATIAVIADRGRKGDKKAATIAKRILDWAIKHPRKTEEHVSMFGIDSVGAEDVKDAAKTLWKNLHTGNYTGAGVVVLIFSVGQYATGLLTHGPLLAPQEGDPNPIVEAVHNAFPTESCKEAFQVGYTKSNDIPTITAALQTAGEAEKKALQCGVILGRARRIQAVSLTQAPISVLSLDTGWEFGE